MTNGCLAVNTRVSPDFTMTCCGGAALSTALAGTATGPRRVPSSPERPLALRRATSESYDSSREQRGTGSPRAGDQGTRGGCPGTGFHAGVPTVRAQSWVERSSRFGGDGEDLSGTLVGVTRGPNLGHLYDGV